MGLDELLESYDEIDRGYRARFNDAEMVTSKKNAKRHVFVHSKSE